MCFLLDETKKCLLNKEAGPCEAEFTRFYYDSELKSCESFIYGIKLNIFFNLIEKINLYEKKFKVVAREMRTILIARKIAKNNVQSH
jgi:hypothetical protein